jgi:ferrochelatase
VLFSAHSIPTAMAATSDYEAQLRATADLVAQAAGAGPGWRLVYQSRSGPPTQPWLGPDVGEAIASLPGTTASVVVAPIGFVSDHMEVVYDLDTEARAAAEARGISLVRAATAGTHPAFVRMIRQLVEERLDPGVPRLALSPLGPSPDTCAAGHCPVPARRPTAPAPGPMRIGEADAPPAGANAGHEPIPEAAASQTSRVATADGSAAAQNVARMPPT